jgi:hypothetical protein
VKKAHAPDEIRYLCHNDAFCERIAMAIFISAAKKATGPEPIVSTRFWMQIVERNISPIHQKGSPENGALSKKVQIAYRSKRANS